MIPVSGVVQSEPTSSGSERPSESEIVDNYRLDHLYTYTFKDDAGKFFTVVSTDNDELPETVEARHSINTRNKIKTTLTFIRARGAIRDIEFKRFKFVRNGWAEHEGSIKFSFPFFVSLIGFLQGLAGVDLNSISERRIPLGNSPSLDPETAKRFQALAATAEGQELVAEVLRSGSITSADLVNIGYRKAQLEIFEQMMGGSDAVERYAEANDIRGGEERVWQCFFEANTWIFGYGLDFVFNQPLEGERLEQTVHGHDLGGPGKRADGVLRTSGIVSSLCLVEIKTPSTALLEQTPYRSDCWQPTRELSGGIAQAQKTAQKTIENVAISPTYRGVDRAGNPTGETAYSYQPKSYLVVGSLSEFETSFGINQERFASFELLRKQLNRPEIITFDELLARAKFIVSRA